MKGRFWRPFMMSTGASRHLWLPAPPSGPGHRAGGQLGPLPAFRAIVTRPHGGLRRTRPALADSSGGVAPFGIGLSCLAVRREPGDKRGGQKGPYGVQA
jgi:hypothetical protein